VEAAAARSSAVARHQWLPVIVAAFAMVATLPGRTHGLGLITEPLLADLKLERVTFAAVNLWATLLGAAFCIPVGWLLDRLRGRTVLLGVTVGLSLSVVGVSATDARWGAFLVPALSALLLLQRGFGQSALSVVSLAIMGRSVGERSGVGVGVYSFISALGFMAAFGGIKHLIEANHLGWRPLWTGIGLSVAIFGVVAYTLLGSGRARAPAAQAGGHGLTLAQALATPAFWIFSGGTSLYGLVAAGLSLFNQSILAERGFDRGVFLTITMVSPIIGLAANLATGWLSSRISQGRLLAVSLFILSAALLAFPFVRSLIQVYLYAVAMGVAGGMVTVIFFAVWGEGFGTAQLGRIQGAAQMLTVFASAAGPLVLAWAQKIWGSYVPAFRFLAVVAAAFAAAAWATRLPTGRDDAQAL
jgi:MFS family permease